MAVDRAGEPEGASDGVDRAASADSAYEQRPERPEGRQVEGAAEGEGRDEPSEMLTREEYADHMRAQGPPIPRDNGSDDAAGADESSDAGEGADIGEAAGRQENGGEPAGERDQAEPRDRETYADDMRGDEAAPVDDDRVVAPGDEPTETAPDVIDSDDRGDERQAAEPLSREEYADHMHQTQPGDRGGTDAGHKDEDPDVPTGLADAVETTDQGIDDGRAEGQQGNTSADDGQQTVAEQDKAESPTGHPPADGQAAERKAGDTDADKVYVDGHEIEVSHDPADGLWIEGLPGEAPEKASEVFAEAEEPRESRGDRLFRRTVEKGDDVLDSVEKNVNLGFEIMHCPPTHAEIPVQVSGYTPEVPHHDIDAGSLATAGLALGVLCWAGGHWIRDRLKGA